MLINKATPLREKCLFDVQRMWQFFSHCYSTSLLPVTIESRHKGHNHLTNRRVLILASLAYVVRLSTLQKSAVGSHQ